MVAQAILEYSTRHLGIILSQWFQLVQNLVDETASFVLVRPLEQKYAWLRFVSVDIILHILLYGICWSGFLDIILTYVANKADFHVAKLGRGSVNLFQTCIAAQQLI